MNRRGLERPHFPATANHSRRRDLLRAAAAATVLPALSACGGGGGGGDDTVAAGIDSFTADKTSVPLGGTVRLAGTFKVTGTVTPFDTVTGAPVQILSGVPLTTAPIHHNTVFTLRAVGTNATFVSDPQANLQATASNVAVASVKVTVTYASAVQVIAAAPDRTDHVQVSLADGGVGVFGGFDAVGAAVSAVARFDPAANAFVDAGQLRSGRVGHTATLLADGTVLVVGGVRQSTLSPIAERWDPATSTSRPTSSQPQDDRAYHTAALLFDGRVLLAGGERGATLLDSLDLYDPVADQFTRVTSRLAVARSRHASLTVSSGSVVVIAGGLTVGNIPAPVEIISATSASTGLPPTVQSVPLPASETTLRLFPAIAQPTASAAGTTDVFIVGGELPDGTPLASTLRCSFGAQATLVASTPLTTARRRPAVVTLGDETIWITGGATTTADNGLASTEVIGVDGSVAPGPNLSTGRARHAASVLTTGRVILTGGFDGRHVTTTTADLRS
jgi:hypothetical protein